MLLLEDRRFYVYVFLDPTKPGNYEYGKYEFGFEPFYVGKGWGWRISNSKSKYILNSFKYNKIKKLRINGFEPIALKYIEHLTEYEAFKNEIDMIKTIGRRDRGIGPLTNLDNGGKGSVGYTHTSKTRKKMSIIQKRIFKDPIEGKRLKELASIRMKNRFKDPNERLKMRNFRLGKKATEETKLKYSSALRRRWKDPVQRIKMSVGYPHSEEAKKKQSDSKMGDKNPNFGKSLSQEEKDRIIKKLGHPIIINNIHYNSIREAGRYLKTHNEIIRYRIKSKNFPNYKYAAA